jgi:chaperone modulatory protein CbpM
MKLQLEWIWLDATEVIGAAELARICGLSTSELDELVDYGALAPLPADEGEPVFSAECVGSLRKACQLRLDFDLELFSVALMLGYLHRIELLERQLLALQARAPAHAQRRHREDAPH